MPTPDHSTTHRICGYCLGDKGLPVPDPMPMLFEPSEVGATIPRSERCCFCGYYTRDDTVLEAPAAEVPHNQREENWMKNAKMTADRMEDVPTGEEPVEDTRELDATEEAGERADPRVVTPQ